MFFFQNGKVSQMLRGVNAIKMAEVAKKELYFLKMEQEGLSSDRPMYSLDQPMPDETVTKSSLNLYFPLK